MAVRAATAGVERETAEATAAPAEAARLVAMAAALLATAALSQGSGRAKAAFDTPRSRRNTGISRSKRIDCEWEKTRGPAIPKGRPDPNLFSYVFFEERGKRMCTAARTHPPTRPACGLYMYGGCFVHARSHIVLFKNKHGSLLYLFGRARVAWSTHGSSW